MRRRQRLGPGGGRALLAALLLLLLCVWCRAAAERVRYAIAEELGRGSLVGPLARDLGLSADELPARKLRLSEEKQYFTVNEENGNLYVNERLDREEMCGESATCSVSFEVLVQNPLNIFHVEVSIEDVNDNSPVFRKAVLDLEIGEWTLPGARFPLEMARDADIGSNSLLSYQLTRNPSFSLALKENSGGSKQPELVLERVLDREKQSSFELVLTAVDGGEPARSGTIQVRINVTDANDNPPVFSKSVYEARVAENLPVGSQVLKIRATDADVGSNGQVSYSFGDVPDDVLLLFTIDSDSGEVRTAGTLDFEEKSKYIFGLEARDRGGLTDHCQVQIDITDENDNVPEITILLHSSPVPEDAPTGTVVALLKVNDRDSGANGEVRCSLDKDIPFRLEKSYEDYYRVVTARELDREQVSEYNVTVRAADGGSPSLQSSAVLALRVLDVNDNAPVFLEERYSARLAENNAAGALVLTVRATDADWGQNARVRYRLAEGRVRGAPLSSYVSVQAETGALYALRSLDYEQLRELQLCVRAEDGGAPALSSNVSVRLQIVDENDNAPQVLYPPAAAAAAWSGVELAPRRSEAGALVAKVVAVDADAGQNAWLSYELAKATEPGLFRVGPHSGEVRTARSPLARDAARHSLVVLVRDHGRPALSATATLSVVLAESVAELLAELGSAAHEAAAPGEPAASLTRWLVLAVAAVSCLFVAFLLLLLALRLRRCHRQQLLPPDSGASRGVPVSHFVGIDGVRAFLQSYSHDVSLTADSRKSHLRFSAASFCDTLPARPPPDEPAPLLGDEDPAGAPPADPASVPPGALERGRAAAAVSRRRLRVSLLAAAERRWSRRRRSVLPPQAARSPGAGRSGSGTDSSGGGGERRPERCGWL
ncbi:protocadherin gamma-A10-like [Ammospiza maritima maritima]